MFCKRCGQQIDDQAVICVHCGVATGVAVPAVAQGKSRTAYILLGIFVGILGVHNFYAGYVGKGLAQLLITIIIGWLVIPAIAVFIWAIIEVITVTQDATGKQFAP